jgi:hypothetical protein
MPTASRNFNPSRLLETIQIATPTTIASPSASNMPTKIAIPITTVTPRPYP